MAPAQKKTLGKVLVIGGCGFLGHHIVDLLLESYKGKFSVLDLRCTRNRRPDSDGVQYFDGDITSLSSILPIFEKIKPDIVIHTASPAAVGESSQSKTKLRNAMFKKVNVDGTACVIEACQKVNVKALVYTSSASVISDTESDLVNADERWPVVTAQNQKEYYSTTKAVAEGLVLDANRSPAAPSLLTCAIRPAAIFGEGDVQLIPGTLSAYTTNKTGFQLGDNNNLFDFTYVRNIAYAHLLAAYALIATSESPEPIPQEDKVDGEAFIITNDQPVYFWDFARAVWKAAGNQKGTEHVWTIGKDVGLLLATVVEWGTWLIGKDTPFKRRVVRFSCMTRYYDCSKAKRRLGYKPIVSLQEGIQRAVGFWLEEQKREGDKKGQ
ncbi:sterol-4-alpha-carboxylate 3-dehydrogenase like protein [Hyaloscypha hepaticicola]|uniref:Sterol-4-alpha-carboxylate 3-dehydrogenase ERG26, decarboxylating n=1 Tax=Hyaloscypha hepaticicola TaxID=2082293 RepID=A0A2J6QKC7_9HELO|nr:sterol-4-alpha-carboxylate 3-dehydrogenase like protein [Hyaloscypha hepaticicola]